MSEQTQITKLSVARQALEEAKTIKEILDVKAIGEAIEYYAKKKKLSLEIQNDANMFLVDAEIKLGENLSNMEKNKGGNPDLLTGSKKEPVRNKKLSDLGISKKESYNSQLLARNKQKVKEIIEDKKENNEPIKKTQIISELKSDLKKEKDHRTIHHKYKTLVFSLNRDFKEIRKENDRFVSKEFSKFISTDMEKILNVMQSWVSLEKECPVCKGKGTVFNPPVNCDNCIKGKLGERV